MNSYVNIDDIPDMEVSRILTSYSRLDKLFGGGLPLSGVSLFAGEGGTGKSRLSLEIASYVNRCDMKVMYFQLEMALPMFKKYLTGKELDKSKFAVSQRTNYEDMVEAMLEYSPKLVVIDSVNMIDDAHNTFVVREMMKSFIKVAQKLNCHILLIGQLGKDGKVKGSTDWVYLPDIVVHLTRVKIDTKKVNGIFDNVPKHLKHEAQEAKAKWMSNIKHKLGKRFLTSVPNKNRFGTTGHIVTMEHLEEGIHQIAGQSTFDGDSFTMGVPYPKVICNSPNNLEKNNEPKLTPLYNSDMHYKETKGGWFKDLCMSLRV